MPYLKLSKDKMILVEDSQYMSSNYTDVYSSIGEPSVHGDYDIVSGSTGFNLPDSSREYKAKKITYTIKLSSPYGEGEAKIIFENPLCESGRFYYNGIETNLSEGKIYSENKVIGSIIGTGLLQELNINNSIMPGPTSSTVQMVSSIDIPKFLIQKTEDSEYFFIIQNFFLNQDADSSKVFIDTIHFIAFDQMEYPYVGYTGTMIVKTGENPTFNISDFSSWTSSKTDNLVTFEYLNMIITIQVSIEDLHYYSKNYDYPIVVEKLSLMDESTGDIYTFNLSKLIEAKLLDKN